MKLKKQLLHKGITKNFVWRFIQIVGKQGASFLIFLLAAKLLSPYEFGTYNYLLAIIFFIAMFADFGISSAISKYVAEYNAISKKKVRTLFFNGLIIIMAVAIMATIVLVFFLKGYLKENYTDALLLIPVLFLSPISSLYDGVYRGLRKFKTLALISICVGATVIGISYYLIIQYGLWGALISQDLLYLLLVISLAIGHKKIDFKIERNTLKEITKYSIILGIASLSYFFYSRVNVLILGHYGYIVEIGYYELVNKIFAILVLPFTILSQVMSPVITTWYAKNQKKTLLKEYRKSLTIAAITSALIAIVVFIFFPVLTRIFLPKYYDPLLINTLNFLLIILVSQSIAAIASIGFSVATGHGKINMYFLIVSSAINLVLTSILVKNIGFMGVIYSTIIIRSLTDFTFIYYYYRTLKREIISKNEK